MNPQAKKAIKDALRPFFSRLKKVSRILRGKHKPNYVMRRRREVGGRIAALFDHTVRYGPFRGMRLGPTLWGTDLAGMLLGTYEKELLDELRALPSTHRIFIDVGGANGYYAVGMLIGGLADYCYCFERSEQARKIIADNAALNGVAERLRIFGSAEGEFYRQIDAAHPLARCTLFVDIEGGEFDLLDERVFEAFRGAIVFVELHDWFYPDGAARLEGLRRAAQKHFAVRELTMGARDMSVFPELTSFNDDDRWVICSEGRGQRMTWWRLDPR